MSATDPDAAEAPPPTEAEVISHELETLRRKVDDSVALLRRSQLALSELAESVGKLVAEQRRRERSFTLNSFVAYCLFTVLLGGAFFFLYQNRADELVADRDRARDERATATRRADDLAAELAARDEAAAAAHAYWKLLEEGKRDEAIARFGEVQGVELTPTERDVFAARQKQARAELVDAGYLEGLDAYRAGRLAEAIPAFERALGYEDGGPRAAQMRYFLGVALIKTGAAADGVRQLELALAGRVDESGVVDARYWLGAGHEKLGDPAQARIEYDRFASANPRHPLSVAARRKSASLARAAKPRN